MKIVENVYSWPFLQNILKYNSIEKYKSNHNEVLLHIY